MKTLFLSKNSNDIIEQGKYGENIFVQSVYRNDRSICKVLAQITSRYMNGFEKIFLGKWARELDSYEMIILEGLRARSWLFKYLLRRKNDSCRLIMWHWNTIFDKEINPNEKLAQLCEQWSFDKNDCEKYGLRYNSQYYVDKAKKCINSKENKKFDIYFLGEEKGRMAVLEQIYRRMKKIDLVPFFVVVKANHKMNESQYFSCSKRIGYDQNIENVMSSDIILDVPIEGQIGETLRVMESLFYRKKLITTCNRIKDLDFYDENNIMVWNEDISDETILDFYKGSFKDSEKCKKAREYYSFTAWVQRFWNEE